MSRPKISVPEQTRERIIYDATSETLNAINISDGEDESEEQDLEWIALGKASTQTYGLILDRLLRQIVPLDNEITYWHEILSSHRYTALYSLQTSPLRFWDYSQEVYREVQQTDNVAKAGWTGFYGLARSVIRKRSIADVRASIAQPVAIIRNSIQGKCAELEHAKRAHAGSIGYMLSHGFNGLQQPQSRNEDWKTKISQNITMMDVAMELVDRPSDSKEFFDDAVGSVQSAKQIETRKSDVVQGLERILELELPLHVRVSDDKLRENARPSRLVRYWLPATAILLSSSTLLRLLLNRRAQITNSIRSLGSTTLDFWFNWVVSPTRKLLATIRHDESSQVSIMSKRSLSGDRASLERMVVDFAVANPNAGSPAPDIEAVRLAVREGDLTPVLRAYERELQSPIFNSLRGNLIRALLIQIQKTKVDVEVAMGGIDALLKSQELVFGFVGLTPGLLVCVGAWRYLRGVFGNKRTLRRGSARKESVRLLRNMDRILTASTRTEAGTLSYESFGLLVCEAIVLRELASRAFPKETFREFVRDFEALIDVGSGVEAQMRVLDRIRWAYGEWL